MLLPKSISFFFLYRAIATITTHTHKNKNPPNQVYNLKKFTRKFHFSSHGHDPRLQHCPTTPSYSIPLWAGTASETLYQTHFIRLSTASNYLSTT